MLVTWAVTVRDRPLPVTPVTMRLKATLLPAGGGVTGGGEAGGVGVGKGAVVGLGIGAVVAVEDGTGDGLGGVGAGNGAVVGLGIGAVVAAGDGLGGLVGEAAGNEDAGGALVPPLVCDGTPGNGIRRK